MVQVETFTLNACPNCGSQDIEHWCTTFDRLYRTSDQQFVYSKCKSCGCLFLSTGPTESNAHHFYPSDYGPYFGTFGATSETSRRDSLVKILAHYGSRIVNPLFRVLEPQTLKKSLAGLYKKGHERFLDFGCGSEQFLNIARDLGWETTGMDFSPQAINAVRHHGHKGILYDSESVWSSIEDGSFEVIRMNHVIEHLYHPEDVLANLHRLLSVNGRIHIATPNASSFSSAHYKQFWLGLDCPRHIVIYNPTSLSHLLKKVGFNRIEIVHETVTKDMARSIGFKQEHQGIIRPQDVSSKVRDNRLKSILYSPSVISTILKRSDRIHAFATK